MANPVHRRAFLATLFAAVAAPALKLQAERAASGALTLVPDFSGVIRAGDVFTFAGVTGPTGRLKKFRVTAASADGRVDYV